jgi:hypothetical protein
MQSILVPCGTASSGASPSPQSLPSKEPPTREQRSRRLAPGSKSHTERAHRRSRVSSTRRRRAAGRLQTGSLPKGPATWRALFFATSRIIRATGCDRTSTPVLSSSPSNSRPPCTLCGARSWPSPGDDPSPVARSPTAACGREEYLPRRAIGTLCPAESIGPAGTIAAGEAGRQRHGISVRVRTQGAAAAQTAVAAPSAASARTAGPPEPPSLRTMGFRRATRGPHSFASHATCTRMSAPGPPAPPSSPGPPFSPGLPSPPFPPLAMGQDADVPGLPSRPSEPSRPREPA